MPGMHGDEAPEVFRAPPGTHDVLPPESARWRELVGRFASRAERAGYGLIVQPVFEHLEVCLRVGEATDLARKEMYEFADRGGRSLVLRPEGTAPVARAFVQHAPAVPWKVWYLAPHFRYERPQRGRYRQHHQLGVEVLGVDDPDVDVEVVALLAGFLRDLGLREVPLLLNSLGDRACRPAYVDLLRGYLAEHAGDLCADSRARHEENPLRVLDCKRPECLDVTEKAPELFEHLCDACRAHFERVQHGLDVLGVKYEISPRLVRGLDYYTRTTFEFTSATLDAAQNAVGGGGRYDGLVEEMGGEPTPGIGFGLGVERLLLACDAESVLTASESHLDVYVVDAVGGEAGRANEALVVLDDLREAGLAADRAYGGRSVKAQLRAADRSRAPYVVIVGPEELGRGMLAVRDMTTGTQVELPREQVPGWIREHLAGSGARKGPDAGRNLLQNPLA